jgi:hypothetical protein
MYVPKFCRVAMVIDDLDAFVVDGRNLLGMDFVSPALDEQFTAFSVQFGQHGLMGIQPHVELPFTSEGRLIEVAVDVADADKTRDLLAEAGYEPVVANRLPEPDADEYLFGRDFHGIPFMVCTRGHNEAQMRLQGPFLELEEAPYPKVASVVLSVDSIDAVAADLTRIFGMAFVEGSARGLGTRALTGRHRVTLVEGPSALSGHFAPPLAAVNIATDAVEETRARFEAAGLPVLHATELKTGGHAYYFGNGFHDIPLCVHPSGADAEMIGG